MPVERIERIVAGQVEKSAEKNRDGVYVCHAYGTRSRQETFSSLDDVADYLRHNPEAGVRMNPDWVNVSKDVHIDGLPR